MKIKKLHLENIGVFDRLDLEFQANKSPEKKAEIHLFTGTNGTGKSTLLYALAGALVWPFRQKEYLIRQRFRNDKPNAFVEVLFEEEQVINYAPKNLPQRSYFTDQPLIKESTNAFWSDKPLCYAYANPSQPSVDQFLSHFLQSPQTPQEREGRSFAAFAYSGNRSLNSLDELTIEELNGDPLDNALSFLESTDSRQIIQSIAAQKMKQAIELSQNNQKEAEQYNQVIQQIEQAIHSIVGWEVKFKLEAKPFNLFLEIDGKVLEFDVLPEGLKSMMSLLADLIRRLDKIAWLDECPLLERHFLLFLDEIDIHLHPAWQRKILPVIQKLFPNAQMFVSTHSPFVVGSVSDAYVYSFKLQENGVSILEKVEESKAGNSYSLILEDVFGVEESFDEETERQFDQFYQRS